MKRIVPLLLVTLTLGAFAWTLVFLYNKSQAKPVVFETVRPARRTIVKKTVSAGAIVPRKEVAIKPRISGVLEKLFVEPGQKVEAGAPIARIRVIPNMVALNAADARVKSADISLANLGEELERNRRMREQNLVSESDFARAKLQYELAAQEKDAARNNLDLVRSGAARKAGQVSNMVSATVPGTVIEVPPKEGASVIESNNFNDGTTIAVVADMSDLIFQGWLDESEVGKVHLGSELDITIGAIEGKSFKGKLEYVAPKGQTRDGAIQFEVRAALAQEPGVTVRAGYSANASIVLARAENVIALDEGALQFGKDGKPFVEVETSPQRFERRPVTTGVSDGLYIEVSAGLDEKTNVKKPDASASATPGPGRK